MAEEGRTTHGTLHAGEHFGDLSMMLGERRTAGVRATSYCDVFVLERGDFDRIKQQYSELRGVLRTISDERSEKASELVLQGVIL